MLCCKNCFITINRNGMNIYTALTFARESQSVLSRARYVTHVLRGNSVVNIHSSASFTAERRKFSLRYENFFKERGVYSYHVHKQQRRKPRTRSFNGRDKIACNLSRYDNIQKKLEKRNRLRLFGAHDFTSCYARCLREDDRAK